MNYHSLFSWLKRQANNIATSEQSSYFTIGKAIVRYSDHYSRNSQCTIQVVRSNNFYIVTLTDYGIPKVYTKVADVKKFLDDYIFIYNCIYKCDLQEPIKEIIQHKEQISKGLHCINHSKYPLFGKQLRKEFELWETKHCDKWLLLDTFISDNVKYNKEQRLNNWMKFKKTNK